jgi:dienelactone hydrolase
MSKWNLEDLNSLPKYRVIGSKGNIQSILYEGEPFHGKRTEVFAYLGLPQHPKEKVPGMVCVHGGGGKAFREWVEMWTERGYAAIAMDLGGRGEDGERLQNSGPEQDHDAKFDVKLSWEDLWTYHSVAATLRANSLLRGIQVVDDNFIGITGISWGGYVTCISAGVDSRFSCAIPVYGCGFLQHNSAQDWLEIFDKMTLEERRRWHEYCDPSVYLKEARMPMLFVSGTNDFAYPLDSLGMSSSLPQGEVDHCVRVGMGHSHQHGWAPNEIASFADYHLKKGPSLPKLMEPELHGDDIQVAFTSKRPISNGKLNYTVDQGVWEKRKWSTLEADIVEGNLQAKLPQGTNFCFFSLEDETGHYVSSPFMKLSDGIMCVNEKMGSLEKNESY